MHTGVVVKGIAKHACTGRQAHRGAHLSTVWRQHAGQADIAESNEHMREVQLVEVTDACEDEGRGVQGPVMFRSLVPGAFLTVRLGLETEK